MMSLDRKDALVELLGRIGGFQISQAIYVAATLGIADHLQAGPRSSDELASASGANPEALHRLLRALASVGVFQALGQRTFALNPIGECLLSDTPTSLRDWA